MPHHLMICLLHEIKQIYSTIVNVGIIVQRRFDAKLYMHVYKDALNYLKLIDVNGNFLANLLVGRS